MMRNATIKNIYIITLLFLSFQMAGCSCGDKKDDFKIKKDVSARTYESDDDEMRKESAMPGLGKDGVIYLGKNYAKGERSPEFDALEKAGVAAKKNKDFKMAEKFVSEGNYAEALKYYSRTGGNIYIEKRMAACKASADRVAATANPDIKKASGLIVEGRPEDALSVLNGIEKTADSGPENNIFLTKKINEMKLRIYKNNNDDKGYTTEYEKKANIQKKVLEKIANTWTPPIER